MKKFDFKKYVEFKVYSVTTIKKGYGFRVLLKFADGSDTTQQHAGFCSKREANAQRDEIIGQLHAGTYIVYGKIKVADFMEFWLEEIMRPRIADNSYNGYKNVVYNYVNPQLGKMYMATLNQGYIRKLYNSIAEKYDLPVSLLMKVNGIENPYNLRIGTRLCIPGTEDQLPPAPEKCMTTHTVKAGDTLYLIAKMHNIKLDALMRANPSIDPYNLLIGTELCIPV